MIGLEFTAKDVFFSIGKFAKREIKNMFICLFVASFMALMVWFFFWGIDRTMEIREQEAAGRYAGLEAITINQEGGK